MTESINEFLNNLKIITKAQSDRQLAIKLGVSHSTIAAYRKKRAHPSDATILHMAKLAKIEPNEALLMLNIWRCEGEPKRHYMAMLKKSSVLTTIVFIAALASQASFIIQSSYAVDKQHKIYEILTHDYLYSENFTGNYLTIINIMRFWSGYGFQCYS